MGGSKVSSRRLCHSHFEERRGVSSSTPPVMGPSSSTRRTGAGEGSTRACSGRDRTRSSNVKSCPFSGRGWDISSRGCSMRNRFVALDIETGRGTSGGCRGYASREGGPHRRDVRHLLAPVPDGSCLPAGQCGDTPVMTYLSSFGDFWYHDFRVARWRSCAPTLSAHRKRSRGSAIQLPNGAGRRLCAADIAIRRQR